VSSTSTYLAHTHGVMIADRVRVNTYRRALQQAIKPGDVVVDIGTGTGLFAIFACQLGARKVYAIETEDIIELAREISARNGYGDRIEFIHAHSTKVTLPEPADVVVSDIHGALPVYDAGLESLRDARHRFLKPGGVLIPRRDRVWLAAVGLASPDYDRVAVWSNRDWGIDLSSATRFGVDRPFSARLELDRLRSTSAPVACIDHGVSDPGRVGGSTSLEVPADGAANGYGVWFDAELADGIWLSSAPGEPVAVYPRQFAPWSRPVDLRIGDTIDAELRFERVNGDYVWRWMTRVRSANGEVRADFRQSSFNSMFVSLTAVRKRAPNYRPRLSDKGRAWRAILQRMDEGLALNEIAIAVLQDFPDAFSGEAEVMQIVASLSDDCGE
jgi:protein arginine N-methyltransferase 1